MADFIPYRQREERVRHGVVVPLSPDRWRLLVDYFDSLGPGKVADLNLQTLTIAKPTEIEGVMFLPGKYRAA